MANEMTNPVEIIFCDDVSSNNNDVQPQESSTNNVVVLEASQVDKVSLAIIFNYLSVVDLTECRMVCKHWNAVGAGVLGKRTYLNINKVLPCCTLPQSFPPSFLDADAATITTTNQLSRRILVESKCLCLNYDTRIGKANPVACANFFHFATKLHQVVHEIRIDGNSVLTAMLIVALNNDQFPHLEALTFFDGSGSNSRRLADKRQSINHSLSITTNKLQKLLPNLKFIKIEDPSGDAHLDVFQIILNSVPNLEQLHIEGNFCPDLKEFCGRGTLNTLSFTKFDLADCRIISIMTMLEQIKFSVVNLTLGDVSLVDDGGLHHKKKIFYNKLKKRFPSSKESVFSLPEMPNLASLNVENVRIFRLEGSLDMQQLPSLRKLSLSSTFDTTCKELETVFHRKLLKCHEGVTTIRIQSNAGPYATSTLIQYLPGVTNLHLEIDAGEVQTEDELSAILQSYTAWNHLKYATVTMKRVHNVSQILSTLEILSSSWRGFITVHFMPSRCVRISDVSSRLKSTFLNCNFKTFKLILISQTTILPGVRDKIMEIIRDHSLPILIPDMEDDDDSIIYKYNYGTQEQDEIEEENDDENEDES